MITPGAKPKPVKLVVIPSRCGLVYYHIQEVYDDGNNDLLAVVMKRDEEKVVEVARMLGDGLPVEVDTEFYHRETKRRGEKWKSF